MRRSIKIEDIPTVKANTVLRTEVYFNSGAPDYFAGGVRKRGYYFSVGPVEIKESFASRIAFSGICTLLEEVGRFSAKRLNEVAAQVGSLPIYKRMIEQMKAKHGLVLASEAADLEAANARTMDPTIPLEINQNIPTAAAESVVA